MNRWIPILLATLAVAAFVHLDSVLQGNFLQFGYKMDMRILPWPTLLYHRYATVGYLLPVLALGGVIGDRGGHERRPRISDALAAATGLASLSWFLGCLLAWQLPHYVPVALIE